MSNNRTARELAAEAGRLAYVDAKLTKATALASIAKSLITITEMQARIVDVLETWNQNGMPVEKV